MDSRRADARTAAGLTRGPPPGASADCHGAACVDAVRAGRPYAPTRARAGLARRRSAWAAQRQRCGSVGRARQAGAGRELALAGKDGGGENGGRENGGKEDGGRGRRRTGETQS
ncbi:hypothetical protein BN6_15600 [Saccharothrix espanaensis DSM 44229]|uniref:Uncharacterized protein n=1 Tax=Saccharothrix espanaensis (strain ATCC 51144 / DSM 44229 / JCM 9112 / NBRC 15066 / NRRL 15764) TaxID=1179773 RepID=K0JXB7_SACES|nr:hypothetical protein BN6_15600 [Saccharothrix espanaensis DSM 44229]